jgi:hypothetical protein
MCWMRKLAGASSIIIVILCLVIPITKSMISDHKDYIVLFCFRFYLLVYITYYETSFTPAFHFVMIHSSLIVAT